MKSPTAQAPENSAPKPKKFFKSRNTDQPDSRPSVYDKPDLTYGSSNKRQKTLGNESNNKRSGGNSKKFFSSKNPEKTVLTSNVNNSKNSDSKPPIVLRICHGKSQLINSSDESESTPTPSSTPSTSTSPRSLRDTSQRSPGHMRITRSTRRSMQQDPSSSPATGDTAGDTFSSFTSPKKDIELSPQYIPAEKYELERKAMYDNLLGITSTSDIPDCPKSEEGTESTNQISLMEHEDSTKDPPETTEDNSTVDDKDEETMEIAEDSKLEELKSILEDDIEPEDATPSKESLQTWRQPPSEISSQPNSQTSTQSSSQNWSQEWQTQSSSQASSSNKIEEDWSSDSDSNSTAPEEGKSNLKEAVKDRNEEILDKILEKPPEQPSAPPVKLVISKKKGSIFKSRVSDGTKKRRALYKHKWSDDKDGNQKNSENNASNSANAASREYDEFSFQNDPLMRISKDGDEDKDSYTSVKCTKNDKGVSFWHISPSSIVT